MFDLLAATAPTLDLPSLFYCLSIFEILLVNFVLVVSYILKK